MQPRTRLHLASCRGDAMWQIEHAESLGIMGASENGADTRNRNVSAFASPQSTVFSWSSVHPAERMSSKAYPKPMNQNRSKIGGRSFGANSEGDYLRGYEIYKPQHSALSLVLRAERATLLHIMLFSLPSISSLFQVQ